MRRLFRLDSSDFRRAPAGSEFLFDEERIEIASLIDELPLQLYQLDHRRRVRYVSRQGREWHQLKAQALVDLPLEAFFSDDSCTSLETSVLRAMEGVCHELALTLTSRTGSTVRTVCTLIPHRTAGGSVDGCILATRPITDSLFSTGPLRMPANDEGPADVGYSRQMHHQIKNSLQGIIGLVRMLSARQYSGQECAYALISRLTAISTVHDLASRDPELCLFRLLQASTQNARQFFDHRCDLQLTADPWTASIALASRHISAVSLVVDELLVNAVKHTRASGADPKVRVALTSDDKTATLSIHNAPAALPKEFSLWSRASQGSGLRLLHSLLPADAAELDLRPAAEGVMATLLLRWPVVVFPQTAPVVELR